jgi:hypothetical protein
MWRIPITILKKKEKKEKMQDLCENKKKIKEKMNDVVCLHH